MYVIKAAWFGDKSFLSWRKGCIAPEPLVHYAPVHPTFDRVKCSWLKISILFMSLPGFGIKIVLVIFQFLALVWHFRIILKKILRALLLPL